MGRRVWFLLACTILIPWQLFHVANHPDFYRPPLPHGDGPDYETIGYSLSIGNGFAFAWNDAQWKAPYLADASADSYPQLQRDQQSGTTTSRPPLVPLVLAAIYRFAGRDANAFASFRCLSALAIGLAGALAVHIAWDVACKIAPGRFTPHAAAATTLTFAVFDRTVRTYAIDFLSEPLALLWATLFLWFGIRSSRRSSERSLPFLPIFFLALCMAAMIATRSMFVFWMPGVVCILLLCLERKAGLATLRFIALVALILCPWWIRNCQQLQAFMPMGAQGAASILGGYSDEALADQGNWHPDAENRLQQTLRNLPGASEWSNVEWEKRISLAASIETRQWIRQHYRDLPTLIALRLKTHWGPYFGKSLIWRLGMLLGVFVLLIHRRWETYWFLGMPLISSLTVMCLYETGGRFLVPLYGLLYALAGIGVAVVFSSAIRTCTRRIQTACPRTGSIR